MVTPKVNETKRGSAHKAAAPAPRRPLSPPSASPARAATGRAPARDRRAATLNSWAFLPTIGAGRCTPRPNIPHPSTRSCRTPSARIGQLPVLDRALRRVRELAGDPESDTNELVAALETDPGLAANVLRFANSAACARPVRAQTVRQAVTLVGRVSVGRLALEAAVCRFFELAPGTGGASRGLLHVHASQVAAVAGALADRAGADVEAAHLAGLLHDLGKLVMPLAFGEEALDDRRPRARHRRRRAPTRARALRRRPRPRRRGLRPRGLPRGARLHAPSAPTTAAASPAPRPPACRPPTPPSTSSTTFTPTPTCSTRRSPS